MGLSKKFNPRHQSEELLTYCFLSDNDNGYKVSSNCYSVFSSKISDPFSQSSFFLIYYFPPSSPPYTCRSDLLLLVFVTSTSSQNSQVVAVSLKKPLLRYHFHINAVRVLVAEHLMLRQQLFLELLYRHAPVCLLTVLIFFFGVLWKIVFVGKSLFFHLSFGQLRIELSLTRFPGLP